MTSEFARSDVPTLLTVSEVSRRLRLSRSELYEQMNAGRLRSVHIGRARRIPASAVHEFIELLEREANDAG